jgi:hypothetical protein
MNGYTIRVRCIDAAKSGNQLIVGQEYLAKECNASQYFIDGIPSAWRKDRFIRLDLNIKLRYIDPIASTIFFPGIVYTATEERPNEWLIQFPLDSNWFSKNRFEVIPDDPAHIADTLKSIKAAEPVDEKKEELAFFARSRSDNTCRCGAPRPCHYHP